MENWRFIPYRTASAALNMAIDEAIMEAHREGKVPPTLRFYGWEPAALSIGYFQKAEREVDFKRLEEHGIGFVRRMTGGRAILHDQELTYSVIVAGNHPLIPRTVRESYRVINQGLLAGFRHLQINASLMSPRKREKGASSPVCFDVPADYELVVEGRKIAGSAQVRQRGVMLQQGSIPLEIDVDLLFSILRFPSERVKERLQQTFADKAVTIYHFRRGPVALQEVIAAFFAGFQQGMGLKLTIAELTDDERSLAQEIAQKRYRSEAWNWQR
jgi:lipoyl(octanoyl) transferase